MRKIKITLFIAFMASLLIVAACDIVDVVQGAHKVKRLQSARNMEFSEADGFYIGRQILANLFTKYRPIFDKKLTSYINKIGQTMAAVSKRPDVWKGYRFIVVDSNSLNAYSLPGGFIMLSRGLLQICDNEDQLAAVIGHELGHARWRHPLEALKKTIVKKRKQELVAFAANRSGSTLLKIFAGVAIVNWEHQLNSFSREQELEADEYSCWLMKNAGYNPRQMIKILRKIPRGRSYYCKLHPSVRKRIRTVKRRISKFRKTPPSSRVRTTRYKKMVLDYFANYKGGNRRNDDVRDDDRDDEDSE